MASDGTETEEMWHRPVPKDADYGTEETIKYTVPKSNGTVPVRNRCHFDIFLCQRGATNELLFDDRRKEMIV